MRKQRVTCIACGARGSIANKLAATGSRGRRFFICIACARSVADSLLPHSNLTALTHRLAGHFHHCGDCMDCLTRNDPTAAIAIIEKQRT